HTDVTCRHVDELAQIRIKRGHEALTEAHHLGVRSTLGIEIRTALGAADGHAGQRILEYLFEAEELDDAQIDRRVKAQSALVRTKRAVEPDPEPAVDLHYAVVILPWHTEDDLPLRFADA